uniref:Regucalcin n=1 Tax=Ixodes ricinus TaxID=34613 RepID=V5IIL5_IXORI
MSVCAASPLRSNLGEGPHWDPSSASLLYVDAFQGDVCRLDVATGKTSSVHFDGTVTFAIPYASNPALNVMTLNRELRRLDWTTGDSAVLCQVDGDKPRNHFNDGKCDVTGRLWAGTRGAELEPGVLDLGKGTLYSFEPTDLKAVSHMEGLNISNGMTWSPDNTTMFFIDSYCRKIYSFRASAEDGRLSNRQTFLNWNSHPSYKDCGYPDGMTHDALGRLWVACYDGGRVLNIDPETGTLLRQVIIPAARTTSCCFGGSNYDELFVTSAWRGLTEDQLKREPLSGSVFRVTGLGVSGCPAYKFNR